MIILKKILSVILCFAFIISLIPDIGIAIADSYTDPSGAVITGDISSKSVSHPRVLYTSDDINYIKSKILNNEEWQTAKSIAIIEADNAFDTTIKSDCADSSKYYMAQNFQTAMEKLATAYILTDDAKYADKAIEFMDIISLWDNLAYSNNNLSIGHWAMGMAIGFDTFYEYLTENEAALKERIISKADTLIFADTLNAYNKVSGAPHWVKLSDNFLGVIGGGVMSLAICMYGEIGISSDIGLLLEHLTDTLYKAASLYSPDGGYFEGISYNEYMLYNLSLGLQALQNATGSDYGIGSAEGFADAASMFVYMQTAQNSFNFHDANPGTYGEFLPYWFGLRYGSSSIAKEYYRQNKLRGINPDILSLLYYSKLDNTPDNIMSLDKYYESIDTGSMRSGYNTNNPIFAAFHGGKTGLDHDSLDAGSFVFETDGIQWATDLGKDDYSLAGYFGDVGYKYYRKNPQGENCLVINPAVLTDGSDTYYGQTIDAEANTTMQSSATSSKAVMDLSEIYQRDVSSYRRGYYFGDNRTTFTIQDELTLKNQNSELYWFMHTKADIAVDGNVATLSYGGKSIKAYIYCSMGDGNYTVSKMSASPLANTIATNGNYSTSEYSKLAIHIPNASGDVTISVKLIPQNGMYGGDEPSGVPASINNWSLTSDNALALLSDINVNADNLLYAECFIPEGSKSAILKINDKSYSVNICGIGQNLIGPVDVSDIPDGKYTAELIVLDSQNIEHIIQKDFTLTKYYQKTLYNNNLSDYKNTTLPDKWVFGTSGSVYSREGVLSLKKSDNEPPALIMASGRNGTPYTVGIYSFEAEIKLSDLSGKLTFEMKNSAGYFYMYDVYLANNGAMLGGGSCDANKWYKMRLVIDIDNKLLSAYIDDICVMLDRYEATASSIAQCKMQYDTDKENAIISYRNFKAERYFALSDNADVTVSLNANKTLASVNANIYYDASVYNFNTAKIYLAFFSENNGLLEIYSADMAFESTLPLSVSIKDKSIPKDTKFVRTYFWSGDNMLTPLCASDEIITQ